MPALGQKMITRPVDAIIPIERFTFGALVNIIAVILILVVCFIAGLLARRAAVQSRVSALDQALIEMIPAYAFVKTMISSFARAVDEAGTLRAVLVSFDDLAQIAFEVERRDDHVVVYLPGSPSPWSGSTAVVEAARVTPLNIRPHEPAKLVQLLGRGSLGAMDRSGIVSSDKPAADG